MRNLMIVYNQSNAEDRAAADQSWRVYNLLTTKIARDSGVSNEVGIGVFAALSPNNDYIGNLRDARRLLEAASAGKQIDDFKVSTYGNNKRKAWDIAHGTPPLEALRAPKTRSFYLNILDPSDPEPVTVDGHIYNAWTGNRVSLNSAAQKVTPSVYAKVADDIRLLGQTLGVIPNMVQAVVWYCWRRTHGIKYSKQGELWHLDAKTVGIEHPGWKPLCG